MKKKKNYKKYCCVPYCRNHSNDDSTYHLFPKNEKLKKAWLKVLKMNFCSPYFKVCNKHFTLNDYFCNHDFVEIKKLKPTSVPSVNLPVTLLSLKKKDVKLAEMRLERMKKREERKQTESEISKSVQVKDIDVPVTNKNDCEQVFKENNESEEIEETVDKCSNCENEINIPITKMDAEVQVNANEIRFSITRLLKTDTELNAYTGINSHHQLQSIVHCLNKLKYVEGRKGNLILSAVERIILTFMRLKLNMSYICLSVQFQVSPNTCKNNFLETLCNLNVIFSSVIRWPHKEEILKNMPKCFENFSSTVAVLDCTEIKIENTKCLKCKIATYSHYKGANTVKILIAVTPSGLISYVSPAYGGKTSDKQIFNKSKILDKTIPNIDSLMVDKGFLIEAECARVGVKLIRPPFLNKRKLSASQAQETATIAAARVHVERTIQRIKQF